MLIDLKTYIMEHSVLSLITLNLLLQRYINIKNWPNSTVVTCWQVRKSATHTNTPAIHWAARVCRKIGVPSWAASTKLASVVVDILSGFTSACVPVTATPFICQPADVSTDTENYFRGWGTCNTFVRYYGVPTTIDVIDEESSRSRNLWTQRCVRGEREREGERVS